MNQNLKKLKNKFTPEELENIDMFRRKMNMLDDEVKAYIKDTSKSFGDKALGGLLPMGEAALVIHQPGLMVPLGFQAWGAHSIYKPNGAVRKWLTGGLERNVPKLKLTKEAAKVGIIEGSK